MTIQMNVITNEKIVTLTSGLYEEYCKAHKKPTNHLKHVFVGNLDNVENVPILGLTTQLFGNSYMIISNEFVGTTRTKLLVDTIKHELSHVFAGVENKHNKEWKKWANRFGAKVNLY